MGGKASALMRGAGCKFSPSMLPQKINGDILATKCPLKGRTLGNTSPVISGLCRYVGVLQKSLSLKKILQSPATAAQPTLHCASSRRSRNASAGRSSPEPGNYLMMLPV